MRLFVLANGIVGLAALFAHSVFIDANDEMDWHALTGVLRPFTCLIMPGTAGVAE